MKTTPFTLDVLSTHKMFFLLNKLPKNATDVDIWIQTPAGLETVDFVDLFTMADGSLLAAWKHPLQKLGLQNLVAYADGNTQILNLYPIERICDLYDRPLDADSGTFIFTASKPINGDWRCDNGYYGAAPFPNEISKPVISGLDEIVHYESFMSVAGVGHLIYIESSGKSELANEKLNNSIIPTTGRTLQEVFRLIYEWSVLAKEPFNAKDEAALSARSYIEALRLTDDELSIIQSMVPMQISNFLSGSEEARVRPASISPMDDGFRELVFSRMASSSMSFIVSRNPEIWDISGLIEREYEELEAGISRFRTYYGVTEDISMDDWEKVEEVASLWVPRQEAYVHNQLRHFSNKRQMLEIARRNETTT
jgi:hypothetical protein